METKFDFSGKTAVVIGGTSGIGLEVAQQLNFSGARTFVASRKEPRALSSAKFIKCDVREESQVQYLVDEVIRQAGTIDILINSMASNQCRPIEEIDLSDWQDVITTNITGIFLTCKIVLPYMKQRQSGKIVNVSSIAGRHRSPVSGVHYVASKAAIIGFTRQLAFEVAKYNINVNAICPSQTMTDMLQKSMSQEELKNLTKNIPLNRIATVEDQVGMILFLCSDAASYITGTYIDVNGGQI